MPCQRAFLVDAIREPSSPVISAGRANVGPVKATYAPWSSRTFWLVRRGAAVTALITPTNPNDAHVTHWEIHRRPHVTRLTIPLRWRHDEAAFTRPFLLRRRGRSGIPPGRL